MTADLLKFELKYHFRQVSFKVAALLFFVLGCFCAVKGGFGSEEVHKNSPYVITNILALLSLFSIFSGTLFSANVVLRDNLYKMEAIVFASSIKKVSYFGVRLLGLLIVVFSLMVLVVLGIYVGSFFIDADRLGPFHITYFLQPLLVFALPNVLFSAGILFCTTILTKSVRAIYVVGVLIYILYMLASIFGNSPLLATSTMKANSSDILPLLLDPFALASFFGETRTWTDLQRNQQLFPLESAFLLNRLLWIAFTILLMLITYRVFNFRLQLQKQVKIKKLKAEQIALIPYRVLAVSSSGFRFHFNTFKAQFKLEMLFLFKNIPMMVMLLLWVFLFGVELKDQLFSGVYGIHSYPATGIIIEEIRSMKFGLILIIFYAAETISREKAVNIHALIYSTPIKNSVLWMAKSLSLLMLVFILVTINIGVGIVLQVTHGYYHIELPMYLSLYYYSAFPLLLFVVLIIFVQNLSGNKYLGMLLTMIVVFMISYAERFGLEHYLFRFATVPDLLHSYFNGFGYYAKPFNWYMLYWSGFVIIIALLTIGMWQRKVEIKTKDRWRSLRLAFLNNKWIAVSALLLWISCGAFIYYQTNIVGKYKNKQERLNWSLVYERKYKAMAYLPQPVVKAVKTNVDLYPNEGKYTVKGTYVLKNETHVPISKIWTYVSLAVNSFSVSIDGIEKSERDVTFNQQFLMLKTPLQPDQEIIMNFSVEVIRNGFTPFDSENSIVENGTYIELEKFIPQFGYCYNFESEDKQERKKVGLPEIASKPKFNDAYELIDFETVISTEIDQQIITVGELQRNWTTNNRRYFKYKTSTPINFMFALSSARYAVKKEKYKGINLSICYQAGQAYNLKSIFSAVKDALNYGNANFANYPLKQFNIVEIPQYKGAATAYPGVVFSAENINFLGNYSHKEDIDQSYAIAAHETAHQWWANILAPAVGAGYAMLTESLAKYTENILIEKAFGKMYLAKYLDYDNNLYFLNRNNSEKELPLAKTLDQPYVHYQKGGLTMYAVKELLGEKKFNAVLSQLIIDHKYPKPRATAGDLVQAILNQASPGQKKFINDCFNEVVTYDLGIKVLNGGVLKNGKYKLDLEIATERLSGGSKQLPNLQVDLACFDQLKTDWERGTKPVYFQKYTISQNQTMLSIIVDHKPKTIAIDPYGYILDGDKSDHVAVMK
ncbi:ABC transporter permease/M1 family aminopeptidase [Pedobacter psychrodurus]|uniref:ABC transporter permease/M1 family aminopeptidase n=1 Tax=Pedobacter psychrodurus TaxID=2530456 RepID=UPI00292F8DBC|nr:M1 family aminopeptidase [Pedobacter psychrodurus]